MAQVAARLTAPLELVSAQPQSDKAANSIRPTVFFIFSLFDLPAATAGRFGGAGSKPPRRWVNLVIIMAI